MKFLHNISIGIKVFLPSAILILALGVVGLLAIYGLRAQTAIFHETHDIVLKKLTLLDEFLLVSERVQSDVFQVSVLSFMQVSERELQHTIGELEQALSDLHVIHGTISAKWSLDRTESQFLERMQAPMQNFRAQALLATANVMNNPSFGIVMGRSSARPFAEFQGILQEFIAFQRQKILRIEDEAQQRASWLAVLILTIAVLTVLAGGGSRLLHQLSFDLTTGSFADAQHAPACRGRALD